MSDAVNDSLGQGCHCNGIAIRVLADDYVVGELEGMVLICHAIDDKRAEAFVRMQVDGIELLRLEGIVLQCTVIGDASAAYHGTPSGVLVLDMFLYLHGSKDTEKLNNKQINYKISSLSAIYMVKNMNTYG